MFFNSKVSSSLAVVLVVAGASIPAHAAPALSDSPRASRKSRPLFKPEQPRVKVIEGKSDTRGTGAKAVALYSALPGSILSLSDTLSQTAMGPQARLGDQDQKSLWIRVNRTDMQGDIRNTFRSRAGALSNTVRLDQSITGAVLGAAVYEDDDTRIDATLGAIAHEGRARGRGTDPKLNGYSTSGGLILEHRTPVGLDLRMGAHYLGGYSEFKVPRPGIKQRESRTKFGHHALGFRAEAGWRLPLGSGLTFTPQVGVSTNVAWVRQHKSQTGRYTDTTASVSTRLSYSNKGRAPRAASFSIEPTYISHFQRTSKDLAVGKLTYRVADRFQGDRAGLRLGAEIPVGKSGTLGVSLSRYWGVNGGRHNESSASLSYLHRI